MKTRQPKPRARVFCLDCFGPLVDLLDAAAAAGVTEACPRCESLDCVDVVRALYVRRPRRAA